MKLKTRLQQYENTLILLPRVHNREALLCTLVITIACLHLDLVSDVV